MSADKSPPLYGLPRELLVWHGRGALEMRQVRNSGTFRNHALPANAEIERQSLSSGGDRLPDNTVPYSRTTWKRLSGYPGTAMEPRERQFVGADDGRN